LSVLSYKFMLQSFQRMP